MNPLSQEYKEAEQNEANLEREKFVASLSKKEQKKFKAVYNAVETLIKADVPFYLFPYLPSHDYKGKHQMWQWNSLVATTEYSKDGKPTEESMKENSKINEAFFCFLFNQFHVFFNGTTLEQKLSAIPFFFYHCMSKHREYLKEGTETESEKE